MQLITSVLMYAALSAPTAIPPFPSPPSGKMWSSAGQPASTNQPAQASRASVEDWSVTPSTKDYETTVLVFEFGAPPYAFSFMIYQSQSPKGYWAVQLKSSGREVLRQTSAYHGFIFEAPAGLVESFASDRASASEWESVISACSFGVAPRATFLRSLPRTVESERVTVSSRSNPMDRANPSSFPAREIHLLILPSGNIMAAVIPSFPL